MARFRVIQQIEGHLQVCAPGTEIPSLARVSARPLFNVAADAEEIVNTLNKEGFPTRLEGDTVIITPTVEY